MNSQLINHSWSLAWGIVGFAVQLSAATPDPAYELLFEDRFTGTQLNREHWTYREGPRRNDYINGLNRKENVTVADGLHIAVRQETIDGKPENTGGGVISTHQFGYGYYETRSRPFMAGHGVHSSFWQAGGHIGNNRIFEIDSYEIDSKHPIGCNNLYVHLAPKGFSEVPWPLRANIAIPFPADGWLIDGYEFTPSGVIFYDLDKEVARVDWPELTAAQTVWLTALNGVGKVDADRQPGETVFAYFRYYAKDYPGITLLPNGGFEYNLDRDDPTKPIAWTTTGTTGASMVIDGSAPGERPSSRGRYFLRHGTGTGASFSVHTTQRLEFIRNGSYELCAKVRNPHGATSSIVISGYGGAGLSLPVPTGMDWTTVTLPAIPVTTHGVVVTLVSSGNANQTVDFDEVIFRKPMPAGQPVPEPAPFVTIRDPIWSLAARQPLHFTGDESFHFFPREAGVGEAITVSVAITPQRLAATSPMSHLPDRGTAGWGLLLAPDGSVIFRIGSVADHRDVIAPKACAVDRENLVTAIVDHGTARILVDGREAARVNGITHTTTDTTKAGRLGSVGAVGEAVAGVIAYDQAAPGKKSQTVNFVGTLRDIRIYNRALSEAEIAGLGKR